MGSLGSRGELDIVNMAGCLRESLEEASGSLSFQSLHLFVLFGVHTTTAVILPFSLPFYVQIKEPSHCMCYMHVESSIR